MLPCSSRLARIGLMTPFSRMLTRDSLSSGAVVSRSLIESHHNGIRVVIEEVCVG